MMDDNGNIYRNAGTNHSPFFGKKPWVSGEDFPKKTNPLSKQKDRTKHWLVGGLEHELYFSIDWE